jgi:hypothetical protein
VRSGVQGVRACNENEKRRRFAAARDRPWNPALRGTPRSACTRLTSRARCRKSLRAARAPPGVAWRGEPFGRGQGLSRATRVFGRRRYLAEGTDNRFKQPLLPRRLLLCSLLPPEGESLRCRRLRLLLFRRLSRRPRAPEAVLPWLGVALRFPSLSCAPEAILLWPSLHFCIPSLLLWPSLHFCIPSLSCAPEAILLWLGIRSALWSGRWHRLGRRRCSGGGVLGRKWSWRRGRRSRLLSPKEGRFRWGRTSRRLCWYWWGRAWGGRRRGVRGGG